jgi:hypothetical protein
MKKLIRIKSRKNITMKSLSKRIMLRRYNKWRQLNKR